MIFTPYFNRVKAQFTLLLPGWKGTSAILNRLIDIRFHVLSSPLCRKYSPTAKQKTLKLIQLARFRLVTCQELKEKHRQCTIRTSVVNLSCMAETGFVVICHVPSKA